MTREIVVGTILLEDRPAINTAHQIESEPFSGGWGVLETVRAPALALKVGAAGWRCFFLTGEVTATVFGPLAIANSQRALRRILSKVRDSEFQLSGGHENHR